MSQTAVVIRTSRPNFLVMAPLCVGLGVALAWRRPETPPPFLDILLVFMGALLAHAAVNMLNEYEDFTSGLDLHTRRTPFSGGSGALPQLPSAARSVLLGALVTLGLVVVIGLYFLSQRGLPMLILGGWRCSGHYLHPLDYPFASAVSAGARAGVWPGDGAGD
jgi:1,4-dihydroxy-2-naphthoate octaprenyltransferase